MIALVISDLAADRAPGFKSGAKTAANRAQCIEGRGYRNPVKLDGESRLFALARQVSGKMDAAIAERRVAGQIVECAAGIVVDKAAVGVEVHRRGGSKLGAVDSCGTQPGLHLGGFGGSVQMQFAGQVAAPAGIGTDDQPCELAQLRLPPIHIEMHRHLAQLRRPVHASLQPHDPGVGLLQAHVSPRRLAAQLDTPFPRILLPE